MWLSTEANDIGNMITYAGTIKGSIKRFVKEDNTARAYMLLYEFINEYNNNSIKLLIYKNIYNANQIKQIETLFNETMHKIYSNKKIIKRIYSIINSKDIPSEQRVRIFNLIGAVNNIDFILNIDTGNKISDDKVAILKQYIQTITNKITHELLDQRVNLEDFVKLIVTKYKFAKVSGYNNFWEIANHSHKLDIKSYILSIIDKIKPIISSFIDRYNAYTPINTYEFNRMELSQYCLSPLSAIRVLINMFEQYYGITCNIIESETRLWTDDVMIMEILYDNRKIGTVYMDLFHRSGKIPHIICYNISNANTSILFANFTSIQNDLCDIDTIVNIGQQLSYGILSLFYRIHNTHLYTNVFESMTEFMIYDNIFMLFENTELLGILRDNMIAKIYNYMTESLFEMVLYTSDEFVNICRKHNDNKQQYSELVIKLFNQMIGRYFGQHIASNIAMKSINDNLIMAQTSIMSCRTYTKLLGYMTGYALYSIIRNERHKFIDSFMKFDRMNLEKSLNSYIKQHPSDNIFTVIS